MCQTSQENARTSTTLDMPFDAHREAFCSAALTRVQRRNLPLDPKLHCMLLLAYVRMHLAGMPCYISRLGAPLVTMRAMLNFLRDNNGSR